MNTKSLVGAVLLGLVFVLVQQIAHRIDALINPACVIIGGVTWATFHRSGGAVVPTTGRPHHR